LEADDLCSNFASETKQYINPLEKPLPAHCRACALPLLGGWGVSNSPMLHYKVYQNKMVGSKNYGKWYAMATVNQTYDLEKLAEHMANHHTPYSKGAILGVLTDMVNCIRELVLDGNSVKIPNLAIFSAGLTTRLADTRKDFNVANNITSVHLRARSTGVFTRAELTAAAQMQEAAAYDKGTTSDKTVTPAEGETTQP